MIILAIDPGITGALAFYRHDHILRPALEIHDMPIVDGDVNASDLYHVIRASAPSVAIIEHVHPHPKEGVSSVWRFSAAFTTARVVVQLLGIPCVLVSPAKWKRYMNLKGGPEGKEQARRRAIENFPNQAHLFSRKKDHGRAEASLLAVYAASLPTIRNYSHEQHSQGQTNPAARTAD
jgi:hypothetical protein